ncbi:hypothetical protein LTR37_016286 [Vermiconidia calcicola]|uniref:Uncharacterized protein n=1 Tax=Vermiconidia calcicola TaxID=1690605 RepID=A0ACC3MPV5_9PEZI|nr:hypothetical protein LTR37_016286 [Vermiconidia calcicola]
MNRSWHWQLRNHRKTQELSGTQDSANLTVRYTGCTPTTMDPTTLMTFLFRAPPETRTVELLGSWDNFSTSYHMQHDRRRGRGFWSGCFKFQNIIFDGDSMNWAKPRTGGLKQGGTYWYFYRLDDEHEAYDESQACTSSCPLLPGQVLNVVEVPVEVLDPPVRCRSAGLDGADSLKKDTSTQTLDPEDKFVALNPPPISRVHGRCVSDLALSGRLESKAQSYKESSISPPASPCVDQHRSVSPMNRPPGRYYAGAGCPNSSYSDRRSSLDSSRSWRSEAPSFAHSSVYDAYGVESAVFDDAGPFGLEPLHEAPSTASRSTTGVPLQEELTYESERESVKFNAFYNDATSDDQAVDALTCFGPFPNSDPQNFDARPTTSYSNASRSPQLPAIHDSSYAHQEHFEDDTWGSAFDPPARPSEEHRLHQAGNEAFDMLSPTFSAATISSGGLCTPYRLSYGCSRSTSAYAADDGTNSSAFNDNSIEDVAERLRCLQAIDEDEHEADIVPLTREPTSSDLSSPSQSTSMSFAGYALPEPDAVESEQSLGKFSSSHGAGIAHDVCIPSLLVQETSTGVHRSLTDDIFAELGFLGSSIS